MANYKEMYEKYMEKGERNNIVRTIHKFTEAGEVVVGKILEVNVFENKKYDTECKEYVIQTDNGIVTCVLGANADKYMEKEVVPGSVIAILYKGKQAIEGGKRVNMFEIDLLTEPSSDAKKERP